MSNENFILAIVTKGDEQKTFEIIRDETVEMLKKRITPKFHFVKATMEMKDNEPYIFWWYKFNDKKKYIKAKIFLKKLVDRGFINCTSTIKKNL